MSKILAFKVVAATGNQLNS